MKQLFIIFSIIITFIDSAFSQNFIIRNVDESAYPVINVDIYFAKNEYAKKNNFKVIEKNKEIPFILDSIQNIVNQRHICFMFEVSDNPEYINKLDSIKNNIIKSFNFISNEDKINVCYYGNKNKSKKYINPLSIEFTKNKELLSQAILDYVIIPDNNAKNTFESIFEAINFVKNTKTNSKNKILIIISNNIFKTNKYTYNLCIDKAKKEKILIYTILLNKSEYSHMYGELSAKTGGVYTNTSINNIQHVFSAYLSDISNKTPLISTNNYMIRFATTQKERVCDFEIKYKGTTFKNRYIKPSRQTGLLESYQLYFMIIGFLFIIMIVFFFYIINKRRITKLESKTNYVTDQYKEKKKKITKISSIINESINVVSHSDKTIVGSNGISPILHLTVNDVLKKIDIDKHLMTVGRNPDCDIVVDNLTISSNHATISNEGGLFYITDNNSTNGTFVNDMKISKSIINNKDTIRVGIAIFFINY